MAHTIQHLGRPKVFTLPDGRKITAKDKIWIPEYKAFVRTAPYSNHVIYETGYTTPGSPPYLCSCGSVAVITGYEGYKRDASAQGALFVCLVHAQYGKHGDGSI